MISIKQAVLGQKELFFTICYAKNASVYLGSKI